VPEKVAKRFFFHSSFNVSGGAPLGPPGAPPSPPQNQTSPASQPSGFFTVNNVTWTNLPWRPFLHDLVRGGQGYINSSRISSITLKKDIWYDIIILNGDIGLSHPYHLHALDMHVVAEGVGIPTNEQLDEMKYETKNPVRRDTVTVQGGNFLVARIKASIPGTWLMHCHVTWHLAGGFAGLVIVQPEVIKDIHIPNANLDLCLAEPPDGGYETEPGRRKRANTLEGGVRSSRGMRFGGG
jgi:FtsP/CotA-like multicopper oxidase with cupredoxin domain